MRFHSRQPTPLLLPPAKGKGKQSITSSAVWRTHLWGEKCHWDLDLDLTCLAAVRSPFLCRCKGIWGWWRRADSLYWSSSSDTCPDTLWTSHLRRNTARWRWLKKPYSVFYHTVNFIHGQKIYKKQPNTASSFGWKVLLVTPERKVRGSRRGTSPLGNFSQASS